MKVAAILMLCVVLGACGPEISETNAGHDMNPARGGEGYGDDHGKTTEVGEKDLGEGYKVSLFRVESESTLLTRHVFGIGKIQHRVADGTTLNPLVH